MRCTDARVFGRTFHLAAALAAALFLVGCSGATRINGRVITGPTGLAVVVDPSDDRMKNPGLPGIEVALLRETATSSSAMITSAVTDDQGNFRMTLARGQHPGNAVIVRTRGDGVYTARSRTYLPRGNQQLLCTVIAQPARTDP